MSNLPSGNARESNSLFKLGKFSRSSMFLVKGGVRKNEGRFNGHRKMDVVGSREAEVRYYIHPLSRSSTLAKSRPWCNGHKHVATLSL